VRQHRGLAWTGAGTREEPTMASAGIRSVPGRRVAPENDQEAVTRGAAT